MRLSRVSRCVKATGVAFAALCLALAMPASAKQFNMTGSWVIRNGQTFIPLQFALTAFTMGMTWHVTGTCTPVLQGFKACPVVGGPLKGLNFPNGPVQGAGVVNASGGPNTIMVPLDIFLSSPATVLPLSNPNIQITTMFEVDAPYAPATLMKGGGPGDFTWCPQNPNCLPPPAPLSAITGGPPPGGGGRGRARMIYNGGTNQFGGTMQIGLRSGGLVSSVYASAPNLQVQHAVFGGAGATRKLAPGGGAKDNPAMELVYLSAAYITQPDAPPAPLITDPGGFVTVGGLTTMVGGGAKKLVFGGATPGGKKWLEMTTNYGFPHTTGTIIGQQTLAPPPPSGPGDDFFTLMGYDDRGPNGGGNIATVAGGISFRNAPTVTPPVTNRPYVSFHKVWLKLQTPVPTMSPAGFAAAAALMLVGVGYALRRRLR